VKRALGALLFLIAVTASADPSAAEVTALESITSRDASGRVKTFTDARHRSYLVAYDNVGRVASIRKRTDRVYVDDLLNVSYADDGRLVSVRFGDGNVWVFSYGEGAVQFVQDRYGAVVTRKVTDSRIQAVVEKADPKGTLSGNLEKLDALITRLNESP
jgi:YD repeat-containing protein